MIGGYIQYAYLANKLLFASYLLWIPHNQSFHPVVISYTFDIVDQYLYLKTFGKICERYLKIYFIHPYPMSLTAKSRFQYNIHLCQYYGNS